MYPEQTTTKTKRKKITLDKEQHQQNMNSIHPSI